MFIFLLFFSLILKCNANTCSCLLGYRNGAQSSDSNLCMGPAENGQHPCYPTPCNSDWTPCSNQQTSSQDCPSWEKDTLNIGMRPDCENIPINSNGDNYLWGTLATCKNKCLQETSGKCNIVSRYGASTKSDTENYHCRFYGCKDLSNINWVTQTQWGNGASNSQSHILTCNVDNVCRTCPWNEHTCTSYNSINVTNYNNVSRIVNVTRYIDTPRYYNITNYNNVSRIVNVTRYIDTPRYYNITNYNNISRIVNVTRYIDTPRYYNITNYRNLTRYINITRYIDMLVFVNKTRFLNVTLFINQTRYIDVNRYHDIINYINQTRFVNKTIQINDLPNITPSLSIKDNSDYSSRPNRNNTNDNKYLTIPYLSKFEIILLIIVIILIAHCIYRESDTGQKCNIRCVCLKLFYTKPNRYEIRDRHTNIQLSQNNKIEI